MRPHDLLEWYWSWRQLSSCDCRCVHPRNILEWYRSRRRVVMKRREAHHSRCIRPRNKVSAWRSAAPGAAPRLWPSRVLRHFCAAIRTCPVGCILALLLLLLFLLSYPFVGCTRTNVCEFFRVLLLPIFAVAELSDITVLSFHVILLDFCFFASISPPYSSYFRCTHKKATELQRFSCLVEL